MNPTLNLLHPSGKIQTVTELKLNLPVKKSSPRKGNKKKMGSKALMAIHCAASSIPSDRTECSVKQPFMRAMLDTMNMITKQDSSSTVRVSRGFDFTSSTNSNFAGSLYPVTRTHHPKCDKERRHVYDSQSLVSQQQSTEDGTDQEIYGSQNELDLNGKKWEVPCRASFVAGAPKQYIGTCPPNFAELAKMSEVKQKFFLTQDPRRKYCLRNPQVLRKKAFSPEQEFSTLTRMVKHADNICAPVDTDDVERFICDVVDLDNPVGLDFQGMDYKQTYENDEQDFQNSRIYRRICRFMDRKRVKVATAEMVEEHLKNERLSIPTVFKVSDRQPVPPPPPVVKRIDNGRIYRSHEKPCNRDIIANENKRRNLRYKNLYLVKKKHDQKCNKEKAALTQERTENIGMEVAVLNVHSTKARIEEAIRSTKPCKLTAPRVIEGPRLYPYNMRETNQFKKNDQNRKMMLLEEAQIKRDFFREKTGKIKRFRELEITISDTKPVTDHRQHYSDMSSDDEDLLEIVKDENFMKIRGFHFKMSEGIRGKLHHFEKTHGKRTNKTCMSREEWLAQIAPKKPKLKMDVEKGINKSQDPDDPNLQLFFPVRGFKKPVIEESAVRKFIKKKLGLHYEQNLLRNLRVARPRLKYPSRKFNLINYLYGDNEKRMMAMKPITAERITARKGKKQITTAQYMAAKDQLRLEHEQQTKLNRLRLLGIPCKPIKKTRLETDCDNSDTDATTEWVPDPEDPIDDIEKVKRPKLAPMPLWMRGNMPAPEHRESTLRRHPRNPRNYEVQRVPSALFDQTVVNTGLPHMQRVELDEVKYSNVRMQRRKYTDIFEGRHHHDHWDATKTNNVNVHYMPVIAKPQITKLNKRVRRTEAEYFKTSKPPCTMVMRDLTMPYIFDPNLIKQHKQQKKLKLLEAPPENVVQRADEKPIIEDTCRSHDIDFQSRPGVNVKAIQYPGKKQYLDFIDSINESPLKKSLDRQKEQKFINKDTIIHELKQDMQSINSCLSSMSSSDCTNLTNDSGSFLLVEGRYKVPMDYIRKSVVPFVEMQRSRFQAKPIDIDEEEANPFRILPFSGQKNEQARLMRPKDAFFTFNSRLQDNIRLRLETSAKDVRKRKIGPLKKKAYLCAVTTDIDENYISELKTQPACKLFKFTTGRAILKQAMRFKFESMLIQGMIVKTKIFDRLNDSNWNSMEKMSRLYEKLFARWEKKEYEQSMNIVYQVKTYYDMSDRLKLAKRDMERKLIVLNMDIVFLEGHWIRRVMLQNFHYLLGDQEWRYRNDWIHRIEGSHELESYHDSIKKRAVVNIRQRDQDDAWAIKAYYDNEFIPNKKPLLIVFKDADTFLLGIENLKIKTFVLLLELHFTLSIHTELQGRLETFEQWCILDLQDRQEYVSRKSLKKIFMEERAIRLKKATLGVLKTPIEKSFNDHQFHKDRAIIEQVFREIIPSNLQGSDEDQLPVDMVGMISDVVVEIFARLEAFDSKQLRKEEHRMRVQWVYDRKQSYQAHQVEKRIEIEMRKVRRNLEPPYQKPKPEGKLPRFYRKPKQKPKQIKHMHISEYTKFFYRAFHDEGDVTQLLDARESLCVIDTIQEQIVPFYFDHFLRINGYTPNYNFRTQIDVRDGPEVNRLQVQALVPEVIDRLRTWEEQKKKIMEDHINRNPRMYENVNF